MPRFRFGRSPNTNNEGKPRSHATAGNSELEFTAPPELGGPEGGHGNVNDDDAVDYLEVDGVANAFGSPSSFPGVRASSPIPIGAPPLVSPTSPKAEKKAKRQQRQNKSAGGKLKKVLTRADIGAPSNFVHSTHVDNSNLDTAMFNHDGSMSAEISTSPPTAGTMSLWRAGAVQKERRLQDEGAASAAAGAPTTPSAALLAALTNPRHSPSPPPAPAPAAAAATAVVVEDEEDEEEFGFGFDGVEDAEDEWDNEMETEPAAMSKRASRDRVNSETSSETSGTGKRLSHISLAGFSDVGDIDDDRESLFARGMSGRSVFSVTSDVSVMSRATSTRSTGGFSNASFSTVSDGDPLSRSNTVTSARSTGGYSNPGSASGSDGDLLSRSSTITSARSAAGFESVTSDEGSISLSRKSSYRGFGDDISLASVEGAGAGEADDAGDSTATAGQMQDRAATPTNADAFPDVVSPPLSHPTLERPKRKGARRPSRQVPDVVLAGSLDEMLQLAQAEQNADANGRPAKFRRQHSNHSIVSTGSGRVASGIYGF